MPPNLRFILIVSALAVIAAPISYAVINDQDERAARINAEYIAHGNIERGRIAIVRFGCGACHYIDGVKGADGRVGPALSAVASRAEIAGKLANTPDQMIQWLRHPQDIAPGGGMPDQALSERDARDIAAYLYTLRAPSH